ncbi:MAG: MFS transporter [Chloroflexi bacterium]|nr:MFS transporter [Chloroflexota bacterium]
MKRLTQDRPRAEDGETSVPGPLDAPRTDVAVRMGHTFRALRHADFRAFWVGQVVSNTGTWMQSIAQAWLILKLTNSPLALGTLTMLQALPVLLLGLFGGVIADRFPKRTLLLVTQSIMFVQAVALGVLTYTDTIQIWQLYTLALSLGVLNALDNPTRQTLVSELVPAEDLPNAVALNSLSFNTSRLLGPAIGGVTIALVGVAGCYFLNAVSFMGVISSLLLIRARPKPAPADRRRGSMLLQVREGLHYAWNTPDVMFVVIAMAAIGTFGYNFQTVLPLVAEYVLNASPASFGLLTSSMALGSVGSALFMASRGSVSRQRIFVGAIGFSVLLFSVSFASSWYVLIPLLVALGVFSILFGSSVNVHLQTVTPPALRGRVMSIYTLLFLGSTPFGSMIVGTLAEHQGVQVALAEMAICCGIGVLASLLYLSRVRHVLDATDLAGQTPEPATAA